MAANTLGLSGRGTHIHSTRPLGAINALTSQSERNAKSAIGGNALVTCPIIGPGSAAGAGLPPPLVAGVTAFPRSSTRAFLAIYGLLGGRIICRRSPVGWPRARYRTPRPLRPPRRP